jgi:hypothetical protein
LCQVPKFAAETERAQKVKEDRKERLAAHQATLKMYSTPPINPKSDPKISPIQKGNEVGRDKVPGNGTAFLDRATFDPPRGLHGAIRRLLQRFGRRSAMRERKTNIWAGPGRVWIFPVLSPQDWAWLYRCVHAGTPSQLGLHTKKQSALWPRLKTTPLAYAGLRPGQPSKTR